MNLALKIKMIRENNKISRSKFARDLNISRSALINYENGSRVPPTNFLVNMCKKFNIDINKLLTDETDDNLYNVSEENAMVLKESNLADKYPIITDNDSINIDDLLYFLSISGYPTENLTTEQINKLHNHAKEFFDYEFFKLGYIKIKHD